MSVMVPIAQAPLPPPVAVVPERSPQAVALLVLGGILCGAGHLRPWLAPLAWLGVTVTSIGLMTPCRRRDGLIGLFLGGSLALWVAHAWQFYTLQVVFPHSPLLQWVGYPVYTVAMVLPALLPVALAWVVLRRQRFLAAWWLAPVWLLGEVFRDSLLQLSYMDWLYSQWQVDFVLRLAHLVGGLPATLVCLQLAAVLGLAWVRRSRDLALGVGLAIALLVQLPAPSPASPELSRIGAVHLKDYFHPPDAVPPGLDLLVWPEIAYRQRPRLDEGAGRGQHIVLRALSPETAHIVGLVTRTAAGNQNSQVAVAPDGVVLASRAKSRLFPLFERHLLGRYFLGREPFVPGTAAPVLTVGGHRVVSLLCLEIMDRGLVRQGCAAGADLIANSAIDGVLAESPIAMEQFLGVACFRAAETGLPLVRSSLKGQSAIIGPDGHVLATSTAMTDGVLTWQR